MPRSSSRTTKAAQPHVSSSRRKRGRSPVSATSSLGSTPASPTDAVDENLGKKKKHAARGANGDDEDEAENTDEAPPAATPSNSRTTIQRGVPAFLNKLYSMVDESSTNNLIRWSSHGSSFVVENHEVFAKTVLPRYYKHNTFASFVRQLNMYDFHKVPTVQQGVLYPESERELWEFSHENFRRDRPDLLLLVSRKRNKDSADSDNVSLATLVKDITSIRKHQSAISSDLRSLQRDNTILWQESLAAREKHQLHKDVIEKILQFLTTVFSSEHNILAATSQQLNGPFMLGKNNEYISLLDKSEAGKFLAGRLPTALIEEAANLVGMKDPFGSSQQGPSDPSGRYHMDYNARLQGALSSALMLSYSMLPGMSPAGLSSPSSAFHPQTSQPQQPLPDQQPLPEAGPASKSSESEANIEAFTDTLHAASKSAEAISQDIDNLEMDIEALASHIGINRQQFEDPTFDGVGQVGEFVDDYGAIITSATRSDKIRLYELAGGSHIMNRYDQSGSTPVEGKQAAVRTPTTATMNMPDTHSTDGSSVSVSAGNPALPQQSVPPAMPVPSLPATLPISSSSVATDLGSAGSAPHLHPALMNPTMLQSLYPGVSLAPPSTPGQPQQFVAVPVPVPVAVPYHHFQQQPQASAATTATPTIPPASGSTLFQHPPPPVSNPFFAMPHVTPPPPAGFPNAQPTTPTKEDANGNDPR